MLRIASFRLMLPRVISAGQRRVGLLARAAPCRPGPPPPSTDRAPRRVVVLDHRPASDRRRGAEPADSAPSNPCRTVPAAASLVHSERMHPHLPTAFCRLLTAYSGAAAPITLPA